MQQPEAAAATNRRKNGICSVKTKNEQLKIVCHKNEKLKN